MEKDSLPRWDLPVFEDERNLLGGMEDDEADALKREEDGGEVMPGIDTRQVIFIHFGRFYLFF